MDKSKCDQRPCDNKSGNLKARSSFKSLVQTNLYHSANIFFLVCILWILSGTSVIVNSLRSRYGTFTVISAKPCQNAMGQTGTCMFMWDCIKSEGLHLGTCSDRFLFGSCCYHNITTNDIDIQRPNTTLTNLVSDMKEQAISDHGINSMSVSTADTTQTPTTTFLQSASSLSDHLSSIIKQKNPQQPVPAPQTTATPTDLFVNQTRIHSSITNSSILDHKPHESSSWYNQPQINLSINQTVQHVTTDLSTPTTGASTPVQELVTSATRPYVQHQFEHSISTSQQHAMNKPTAITAVSYPQQVEQTNTLVSPQTQRPAGSWLSRPASLLANAFFHSFKPFPYLNSIRQRPTYRPHVGVYRPPHYRPSVGTQSRPNTLIMSSAQQVSNAHGSELVSSSTSENTSITLNSSLSLASLPSASNQTNPQMSNTTHGTSQDNNDHHIVNPNSPSISDRHRPVDRNHFTNAFNDSLNTSHNHYEVVTVMPSNNNNSHPNLTYNHNENAYKPSIQFGSQTLTLDEIEHPTTPQYGNNSLNQLGINIANTNFNINSQSGLAASSFSTYDQTKPEVLFSQHHNDSGNYPSYPLVSNYPPSNINSGPIQAGHLSTPGSIDEIPGLSVGNPTRENYTTIINIASSEVQGQHQTEHQTLYDGQFGPNQGQIIDQLEQHRPPPQVNEHNGSSVMLPPVTITDLLSGTTSMSNSNIPIGLSSSFVTSSSLHDTASTTPMAVSTTMKPLSNGGNGGGTSNTLTNINKKGSQANKEVACGVTALYPQTKVVGGKNAAFGAWPWQVSVRKVSFFGFSSTHRCGGAVISSEWIATAGHCVEDLALQSIRIRVGEYDFSSMSEPFPYIERAARRKVVHPKYNFYTYENDLALVQLDQPIQFPPHVAPICLPPDNIDLLGRNATVTGWGRLNEGGTLPTILQEVRVPIVSNDKCKDMFLSAGRPEYIPDIFLCAGYEEGGRDSCQGDSGGPLQVKGDDGKWFLAGIISWGIGCAEQNLPGVCTRISRFKLWIQSTMNSSG